MVVVAVVIVVFLIVGVAVVAVVHEDTQQDDNLAPLLVLLRSAVRCGGLVDCRTAHQIRTAKINRTNPSNSGPVHSVRE